MSNITQLRESRAKLIADARKVIDNAESEKRTLKGDEQQTVDRMIEEAGNIKGQIDLQERKDAICQEERELVKSTRKSGPILLTPERNPKQFSESLRTWLLAGTDRVINPDMIEVAAHNGINLNSRWLTLRPEYRALSKGTTTAGGYTVPDSPMGELERTLKYFGPMRQAATILTTSTGSDLPIPTNDDTGNVGAILAENIADSEQDTTFGQVVMQAFKYTSKIIRVSVELLQDSSFDFESFLASAFAERIGRIHNTHFTTGDASSKPNGVVTASGDSGIEADDVSLTMDNLIDLAYSVDPLYRVNGAYMMNDSTAAYVAKLKDSTNQYLWQPSVQAGQPDRLKGYPVWINNDMAAIGASAKSVLFGDFKKYLIRDCLDLSFQRLDERYAEYHQVGFVMIARTDGDLLNANAVKYLVHAAS